MLNNNTKKLEKEKNEKLESDKLKKKLKQCVNCGKRACGVFHYEDEKQRKLCWNCRFDSGKKCFMCDRGSEFKYKKNNVYISLCGKYCAARYDRLPDD